MRRPLAALLLLAVSVAAEIDSPAQKSLAEQACLGQGLLLRQAAGANQVAFEEDAAEEFSDVLSPVEKQASSAKEKPKQKTWRFKAAADKDGRTDPSACAEDFALFQSRHGSSVDAVIAPAHGREPSVEESNLLFSRVKKRMSNINSSDIDGQAALAKLFDGKRSLPQIANKHDLAERALQAQRIAKRMETGQRALNKARGALGADSTALGGSALASGSPAVGVEMPLGGGKPGNQSPASKRGEVVYTADAGSRGGGYSSLSTKAPPDDVETPAVASPVPEYIPGWLWDAYQVSRSKIGDTIGALGSPWNGRLKDGIPLPWNGEGFRFVRYGRWGTTSMVYGIQLIAKDINFPDSPPLQIGDISYQYGGPIRRHKSHQNGTDVDIFFAADNRGRFDADRNLLLAASAVKRMNVTNIFIDSGYKAHLVRRSHAVIKSLPPDRAADAADIKRALAAMSHEPGHRDHFHIRIR